MDKKKTYKTIYIKLFAVMLNNKKEHTAQKCILYKNVLYFFKFYEKRNPSVTFSV